MLEAYFTEDDYFEEILHYCNVIMDSLVLITHGAYDYANDKDMRKFTAYVSSRPDLETICRMSWPTNSLTT